MEDFLVYGLVMLGLIVTPTAIINGRKFFIESLPLNLLHHETIDFKLV